MVNSDKINRCADDFFVYAFDVSSKKLNALLNFLFSTTTPQKKVGKLTYYSTANGLKRIKLSTVSRSKNIIFAFDYRFDRGISFENLIQYLPYVEDKNDYVFVQKNIADNFLHIYSK